MRPKSTLRTVASVMIIYFLYFLFIKTRQLVDETLIEIYKKRNSF